MFIKKEALAQVLSCEFFEISKNTFFHRTPLGDCFCEMNIIWLLQKRSYCRLIVKIFEISQLLFIEKFYSYLSTLLPYKHIVPVMCFFPLTFEYL